MPTVETIVPAGSQDRTAPLTVVMRWTAIVPGEWWVAQKYWNGQPNGGYNYPFKFRYRLGAGAWTYVYGTQDTPAYQTDPNIMYDFTSAPALVNGAPGLLVSTNAQANPNTWTYTFPGNFFAAGTWEFQFTALGHANGVVYYPGWISATVVMASVPNAPTIAAPAAAAVIPTSDYTFQFTPAVASDAAQIRIMNGATQVYDSGTVTIDTAVNQKSIAVLSAFNVNNSSRQVMIRTRASVGGLWSGWTQRDVTVSWTPPPTPTFSTAPTAQDLSNLGPITLQDAFTVADLTNLSGRTPPVGWQYEVSGGAWTVLTNQAFNSTPAANAHVISDTATGSPYGGPDVVVQSSYYTGATRSGGGVIARRSGGGLNWVTLQATTSGWRIVQNSGGTVTVLATAASTPAINTLYDIRLELIGDQVAAYVNGLLVATATTTILTGVHHGLWGGSASQGTQYWDNIQVNRYDQSRQTGGNAAIGFGVTVPTPTGTQASPGSIEIYARKVGDTDDGVLIGTVAHTLVAAAVMYQWMGPAHGVAYQLRMRVIGTNLTVGTYSAWTTVTGTASIRGATLHDPLSPLTTMLVIQYNFDGVEEEREVETALLQYAGREFPVVEFGTAGARAFTLDRIADEGITGGNDIDLLKALVERRTVLCYRDRRGRIMYGLPKISSIKDRPWGKEAQLQMTQTYTPASPPLDVIAL